jgi:hypothetical protein
MGDSPSVGSVLLDIHFSEPLASGGIDVEAERRNARTDQALGKGGPDQAKSEVVDTIDGWVAR